MTAPTDMSMTAQLDGMEVATLGEFCTFKYGKSLAAKDRTGSGNPVYGSNGVVGFHDDVQTDGPAIVIGRKGSYGEVNFSTGACWPIDTTYFIDRTCTDLHLEWLKHLLSTLGLNTLNRSAAVPGLNREDAYRIPIAVPSKDEQRRIATILDKAEELRTKRRQAIAKLDTITQAIFYGMFGDPVNNSMGWPQQKLNTLGRISTGNTPPRAVSENFGDYLEWVKTDNINTPQAIATPAREGLSEQGARKARIVPSGSVLVTCIAGSPGVIGNVALTDRTVAFNQQINAFTPNSGPSLYWYALLKSMKPLVQKASSGGMKGLVSKSALSAIDTIVVPDAIQEDFAERLAAVERLKSRHESQLAGQDALFASLQHRAFRGKL